MAGNKNKTKKYSKQNGRNRISLGFVKEALTLMGGLAGSILAIYGLIRTFKDDAEGFSWLILVGIGVWLYLLWRLFQVRKITAYSLLIISILVGVIVWIGWQSQVKVTENKVVVLVAQFDGPEEKYGVRDQILEQLREATKNYKDTEIIALDEVVTSAQGSEYAHKLGEDNRADLVIWAWYRPTENPNITLHFESLSLPVAYILDKSATYQPQATLSDLESFEIQRKLGSETSTLVQFLSGYFMYMQGDYQEASSRFEKILTQEDISTFIDVNNLYLLLGALHLNLEQYDRAVQDYSKIIERDSNYIDAYNNRGVVYADLAQYDQAMLDYEKVIELDPNNASVYNNRANSYYDLGQFDPAIQDYNKAIALDPNYTAAYNNRGRAYDEIKQYDQAIQDYSKAIEIDPNYFNAYYNRGISYAHMNQYDRAIQDFNKTIEIAPENVGAYNNRGNSYLSLDQYDLAIQDFNKAITLDPNYTATYNNRGISYFSLRQYGRAIRDFNKAIDLDPNNAGAYKNRSLAYNAMGKESEAEADFKKYEELTGQKP